jgi:ATP-dependent exoDNAse (exonuclease V) alpha subunit
MFHLTARVAWHDSKWKGTVCNAPSCNPYCTALGSIHKERNDELEDALAGRSWSELNPDELPACKSESGGFMNPTAWSRKYKHPYAENKKAVATHGQLKPTMVSVPPYSAFAVPFNWMLRKEQDAIDQTQPVPLPPDEEPPFPSPWVFSRTRQEALVSLFYGRLVPERSLVFFYCKEGQPLGDTISRLIVGVGRITGIERLKYYETDDGSQGYPMWDRLFRHSIRPDESDGFLLPYHEYLEETGDPAEDARRRELLQEIAVAADAAHMKTFSYAGELAPPDIALSTLVRCLESVRKIREHGIAPGQWEAREEWLNEQIARCWEDRGAFPGLGPALEAIGMRLGTALALELLSSGTVSKDDDPWPTVDQMLRGETAPPQPAYADDLAAVRGTWSNLEEERRTLLKLLSRFALTAKQFQRCYEPTLRAGAFASAVTDFELIENPYRLCELDLGDLDDSPVIIGTVDRGMLPDSTIAARHPVPAPSTITSHQDPRRVRAAIVSVLRKAAAEGDALLSITETLSLVAKLDLAHDCLVSSDWPAANRDALNGVVELIKIPATDANRPSMAALQLSELQKREKRLARVLSARAEKPLPAPAVNWEELLKNAIATAGVIFDPANSRHCDALAEQLTALEQLVQRKLSVLVGRAGTGKTSIMGALLQCEPIVANGVLLLAPTGKARVRLGNATNAEAMTVAQFLTRLKRYDSRRQRPLFQGEVYRKEKTVVIDECSMLTMDDLVAVMEALDLNHVKRIILVGDPNQLPPIGVGRPFADLVSFLENSSEDGLKGALARLSVEVRATVENETSDTLRLASWFTREAQPVDADRVLSDLELGNAFNDLQILFWNGIDDLKECMLEAFVEHFGMDAPEDILRFDASLGLDDKGWVPYDNPNGSELWQILSPVRMQPHGVIELNRWIQRKFRGNELVNGAQPWGVSLGDECIVRKDKVIQTINQRRGAYNWELKRQTEEKEYIANGEVGLAATGRGKWLNIAFARRPYITIGYQDTKDFSGGNGPLQLAYAITVHKAQGSEFRKVFAVIPKNCRPLSRELVYTALTRSRDQLILLMQGDNASSLFDLTRPERSETARRNTNLFFGVVRSLDDDIPFAEHLIHRTAQGHLVRSKSELVIANLLHEHQVQYEYERVCEGEVEPGRLRPDFSFVTPDGDLIIWEHLGMMNRDDYRRGWEWKRQWYLQNGFMEGQTLFSTVEDGSNGLDTASLKELVLKIRQLCE